MKRTLNIALFALTAAISVGCGYDGSAIKAEAPGGHHGLSNPVGAGTYTLYHVTKFDNWGRPATTEEVTTLDLKADEKLGFEYVLPPDKQYEMDASSDVVAFAGSFRRNLGPIQTINDHYYWCNPGEWGLHWATRSTRVIATKLSQY